MYASLRKAVVRSAFVAALAVLALPLTGCRSAAPASGEPAGRSALPVTVEAAAASDHYTVEREFAGRVEARRASAVGFEIAGELDRVLVDEGDVVGAGEALAMLDVARLHARLAEVEASHAEASSAREFAARTLERSREAAAFDGISAQELDLAVDKANAAEAALAAAEARANSVRVDIEKSTLRAPFDAVVIRRHADEGQIVAAGQVVLDLQEAATPRVRIGIAGRLADTLEKQRELTLHADERRVPATVDAVLPRRDPATRTVDVLFSLKSDEVLPGDMVRLILRTDVDADGFWLPIGALADGGRGLWQAYVALPLASDEPAPTGGATHRLQPRAVEVLHETDDRVFVRGALSAGDLYLTGGLTRVVPDQRVRLAAGAVARTADGTRQ